MCNWRGYFLTSSNVALTGWWSERSPVVSLTMQAAARQETARLGVVKT